jgi:ubiquitin-conjugating enzyme E2 G1
VTNLELSKNTDAGFSVGLVDDNDFYKWAICFTGPEDTIYEVK